MKISLILATVGRTTEVGRCLKSLASQTDANFEVLLVDQNRDERLAPFVQEALALGIPLTHLRMDKPSLSGARNLGIAQATGEVIGFTDDDCWYEPQAIQEIRLAFLHNPALDGTVAQWVEQTQARQTAPSEGPLQLSAWRRFRGGDASSISLFFKKPLFTRLGGFDERLGIGQWYGAAEETDFVLRALASSAQLAHCPAARVHHHFSVGRPDTSAMACRNARLRARGTGALYAKHQLSLWVVLRGLFAPVVSPLLQGELKLAKRGGFIGWGRTEGFLRWKLKSQP